MTSSPTIPTSRKHTPEELINFKDLDIFTFLKRHSSVRKCSGCKQPTKMLDCRSYCAICSFRLSRQAYI